MKILFVGDVQGESNARKLKPVIPKIRLENNVDVVIINGENSADTNGITPVSANILFDELCADVITTGNHAFRRCEMDSMFDNRREVIRPANFGDDCPGRGFYTMDLGRCSLCVINIMGMTFMPHCDNPFRCIDDILKKVVTKNIIVDFHAEASAEKKAMALYLSGRVSAVVGTHTHVQTADEQLIDNYTAFITDVGMTGALDSVIGSKKNVIDRFIDYYPQKHMFASAESGKKETEFCSVLIEIEEKTGRAISIKRMRKFI